MSSVVDAHRAFEAAAVAELVAERVGQIVRLSSVDGFVARDPILVLEAIVAHLLAYAGSEIVIRENTAGPGLVLTHSCRRFDPDQGDQVSVVSIGQFAVITGLTNIFHRRDDLSPPVYFDEAPF